MGNWVVGRNSVALQSRAGGLVVVMGSRVGSADTTAHANAHRMPGRPQATGPIMRAMISLDRDRHMARHNSRAGQAGQPPPTTIYAPRQNALASPAPAGARSG